LKQNDLARWLAWGLLCVLVALAWANGLDSAFTYDDKAEVIGNRTIRVLDQWRIMLDYNWSRPVTISTYALNYHFAEREPFLYHLVDAVIHAVNAGLAMLLVAELAQARRLERPLLIGLVAAAIWALHPLQTESVTYVTGRSEQLVATAYLGGCLAFARWRAVGGLQHYVVAWVAVVVGAFTKEVAVTMPVAFALIELTAYREGRWRELAFKEHIPGVLGVCLFFGWRWHLYGSLLSPTEPLRDRWGVQIWTQAEVWWRYLQLVLVPLGQSVFHDHPETGPSLRSVAAMLGLFGLTGAALWGMRKRPLLALAWMFYALVLLPSSSIEPLKETMAEHRLHISLLGPAMLAGVGLVHLGRRGLIGGGLLTLVLLVLTFQRNRVWADEVSLWGEAAARNPASGEALYGYGDALHLAEEHGLARDAFQEAIEVQPGNLDARTNLGREQAELGNRAEAEAAWLGALEISPSYCRAHNNLGLLHGRSGDYRQAERDFRTTLAYCPNDCIAHRVLGEAYHKHLDDPKLAVLHYQIYLDRCGDDVYAPNVREELMKLTW
jgi:tetratricopeptide (TPR) repeat protein